MTSQPNGSWQFRLRDLAWLTVIVALAAGWRVDRQAVLQREASAKARIEELTRDNEYLIQLSKTQTNRAQSNYTEWMAAEEQIERLRQFIEFAR